MKNILQISLVLCVLFQSEFVCQFILLSEKVEGNRCTLHYRSPQIDIQFYKTKADKYQISFPEFIDESKPGTIVIPKAELFIPLPLEGKPILSFNVVDEIEYEAYPTINPNVSLSSKGEIILKQAEIIQSDYSTNYINHGVKEIDENYYIHLTIHIFSYDIAASIFTYNKEFTIELLFNESIQENLFTEVSESTHLNKASSVIKPSKEVLIQNDTSNNWIDYNLTYLKIGVGKDAIYRITYDNLIQNGIDLSQINPKTFQMYWKGREMPIYVFGEEDSFFNEGDFIEFVGIKNYGGNHRVINTYNTPYNDYFDRYSDTTIVWLTWGKNEGKRMPTLDVQHGTAANTINYYNHLIHEEKNVWFDFSCDQLVRRQLPEWIENETWMWRTQGVGNLDLPFQVVDLVPNKTAKAFIKLQSYASNITKNAHKVGLRINNDNAVRDSSSFDNYQQRLIKAKFNSNLLSNGTNQIKSVSFQTSGSLNSVFHDWYEIEYPRTLLFKNDSIVFKYNDYNAIESVNYEIGNYSGSDLSIYRFHNMTSVSKVTDFQIQNNKVILTDYTDSLAIYYACNTNKIISPKIYGTKKFVNLRSTSRSADYVILTHKSLLKAAEEYAKFINTNYSKNVSVILIDDIYDEFNYGFTAPEPIKEFLKSAYSKWNGNAYEYVLLLGSANYDYFLNRNRELPAPHHPNFVPSYGVPVSDNWFLFWDSNGVINTNIKIGRIPARNESDVYNYLNNHRNYLFKPFSNLNKRYLFFSGGVQSELEQLKSVNDFIIDNYVKTPPIGGNEIHFYKTMNPNTNFGPYKPDFIDNAIKQGSLFISYLGHSGTQTWDNSITEVHQLYNTVGANPLITDFGCSTAKFAEPDVTSFSELFTVSGKGQAIAYIGNSSLGFISTSTNAPKLFYKSLLKDSTYNIAQTLLNTKKGIITNYGNSLVNQVFALTNTLIGDPIVNIKIPSLPNLVINENSFSVVSKEINSSTEKALLKIKYFNFGKVEQKNFNISIKNRYQGNLLIDTVITKPIPLYVDSLELHIDIKNKPGFHELIVRLDSENKINEIYEDDNNYIFNFFVANTLIRDMSNYSSENKLNSFTFINPIIKSASEEIEYHISDNPKFLNSIQNKIRLSNGFTKINLNHLQSNKRYWMRAKLVSDSDYSLTRSFTKSDENGFYLGDSISFSSGTSENLFIGDSVKLADDQVVFEAISAGFNDGNTAIITKNNQNYIPWPNRGHNVCVFDGSNYEFKKYEYFDLLFGGQQARINYLKLLDSLKTNDIIIIAIVDEGSINFTSEIKQRLKNLGSNHANSIGFRDSWSFIAQKGAASSSMLESYSKIFNGRAITKKIFLKKFDKGKYTTIKIGPSNKWNYLRIEDSSSPNNKINYSIYGVTKDNKIDTLNKSLISNQTLSMFDVDAKKYPFLFVNAEFNNLNLTDQPVLKNIFINYQGLPELGTNYQSVRVNKDTVEQGENILLDFCVYNAGAATARNIVVVVKGSVEKTSEKIFEGIIDSLNSSQTKNFSIIYKPEKLNGNFQFEIIIDSNNHIIELYEDNNYYTYPIFIKPDISLQTLSVLFDGIDIMEGDYVSANPEIAIALSNNSRLGINDTSAVTIYINNKLVSYYSNQFTINYKNENPKMSLKYLPSFINGEHSLKIVAKNIFNLEVPETVFNKKFIVNSNMRIEEIYNYPNPFSYETYFTFKLSQLPDKLRIKVFTLTGRLIKQIELNSTELNIDFNRIFWDGKDEAGDLVANGVYLYKIILEKNTDVQERVGKLAIVR
jgi:hypothetical protein